MEIPEEMIETLVPAVREQLESPDTAYVKNCLERLTGREKLGEQETPAGAGRSTGCASSRHGAVLRAVPGKGMRWRWGAALLIRESTRRC